MQKYGISLVVIIQVILAGWGVPGRAQDATGFQVIVNPANPLTTISKAQLSKLLLKKEMKWENGKDVLPVDLKANSKTREVFSAEIHGRPVSAIKAFWQKMIFSGRQIPPPEIESDQAVIDYVSGHPGAVGYISSKTAITRVKKLEVIK